MKDLVRQTKFEYALRRVKKPGEHARWVNVAADIIWHSPDTELVARMTRWLERIRTKNRAQYDRLAGAGRLPLIPSLLTDLRKLEGSPELFDPEYRGPQ